MAEEVLRDMGDGRRRRHFVVRAVLPESGQGRARVPGPVWDHGGPLWQAVCARRAGVGEGPAR